MALPCSRPTPWLHAGGRNPGSTSVHSRLRGLRFCLPPGGMGSAAPITIDFGAMFPFTCQGTGRVPASRYRPLPAHVATSQPKGWIHVGTDDKLADNWLPKPTILHPWPSDRFAVAHPRGEPYAGKPPVRLCAGCALQVRSTQPSKMTVAAKPSEQPSTESCLVGR
jgi:hypothetical protein